MVLRYNDNNNSLAQKSFLFDGHSETRSWLQNWNEIKKKKMKLYLYV